MDLKRQAIFASSIRVLFGVLAVVTFPAVFPDLMRFRWLLVLYTVLATGAILFVQFNIADAIRPYLLGAIDLCLLTMLLHIMGPATSVIVVSYFLLAILNALIVSPRFGTILALAGCITYGFVLAVDVARVPLFGITPGRWRVDPAMSTGQALFAWTFVTTMLVGSTMVVASLLRRLRHDEARLQELIKHDSLTGLFNRRHLLERMHQELGHVRRGRPLSIIMLDLDGFKRINDAHGHAGGDRLLGELAEALRRTTRETDVPGRWGGDEFVVLLPATHPDEARMVADRLTEQIRVVGVRFDPERPVTASLGLACARPEDSPTTLLNRADTMAYDAKQAGGNRVSIVPR